MTRRQFNLRALKQIREMEQSRARERLAQFVDPHTHVQDIAEAPTHHGIEYDAMSETRRDIKPVSGPLSDRLRLSAVQAEQAAGGGAATRATLDDLDGNVVANLPCDESAGIIILGRGQNATVRISDPYVHRVHAHMRWDSSVGAHIIVHGGGENATYVNRRKIRAPLTLQSGNRIRIGRTELIYRIH